MSNKLNRRKFISRSAATTGVLAAGMCAARTVKAATGDWADLTGRFTYNGTPPERKKLKVDKDIECCGKFDIRDESLMVAEDGGLGNVYVYVRTRNVEVCPDLEAAVKERVMLDNRDCIFIPHCMKIWYTKQEYYIVNSDPVAQNVAYSPLGDVPANIVIPVGGEATWKFNRKQNVPVPVKCNYHPWESAYVLPRDNPYVAITGTDGTFTISKLPAGELEFQVWHERAGYLETPSWTRGRFTMTLEPGENDLGTIEIAPAWLTS